MIYLSFEQSITEGTKFELIVYAPIYSKSGSILDNYNYTLAFHEYEYISKEIRKVIERVEESSETSTFTFIALAFIGNPSAAWVLINTIQMIYFLPFGQSPLTPASIKICKSLGKFNGQYNAAKYIFGKSSLESTNTVAKKLGIESSEFFMNFGSNISILVAIIFLYPLVFGLSKSRFGRISEKIKDIEANYKYSFFIRFWLQNILPIGFFSILCYFSVIHKKKINALGFQSIFNLIFSQILIVRFT